MTITASYSLTLADWLEAGHVHRNPIQVRKRRSSLILMAWVLVPFLPVVANFILAFTPYAIPPQVLNQIAPFVLTATLIGAVLFLSGPSMRKTTPWLAILLIVGGMALGIFLALADQRPVALGPAANESVSILNFIWPLVPWVMLLLGMAIAVKCTLERIPRREWESSPSLRHPTTVSISDTGVTFEQPDQTHQFQWSAFLKVRESKDVFVLYTSENRIHILPKRAFPPDDLAALAELLKSKVVPADAISTAFSVIAKPAPARAVHVQPLESRDFM